jgi:hypothetical protein
VLAFGGLKNHEGIGDLTESSAVPDVEDQYVRGILLRLSSLLFESEIRTSPLT